MKKLKLALILVIAAILGYKIATNLGTIKSNFSWIFEGKEEEAALPELSNEEIEKNSSRSEEILIEKNKIIVTEEPTEALPPEGAGASEADAVSTPPNAINEETKTAQ